MASVPEATPTAHLTPQYAANSDSNAARLGPFKSLMTEKTASHWGRNSASIDLYFRVRSKRGIFLASGVTRNVGIGIGLPLYSPFSEYSEVVFGDLTMLETIVFSILADMNRCTMTLLVVAWPTFIALLYGRDRNGGPQQRRAVQLIRIFVFSRYGRHFCCFSSYRHRTVDDPEDGRMNGCGGQFFILSIIRENDRWI